MKATFLNGCTTGGELASTLNEMVLSELNRAGFAVKPYVLKDEKIAPCMGCFECWVKTPGICVRTDIARDIARDIVQSEVLIYLTPVVFGGYSSELKKALDRSIPIILPFFQNMEGEIHHKARYKHYPNLLVLGFLNKPNPEYEKTFRSLVERNAINMHNAKILSEIFVDGEEKEVSIRESIQISVREIGGTS